MCFVVINIMLPNCPHILKVFFSFFVLDLIFLFKECKIRRTLFFVSKKYLIIRVLIHETSKEKGGNKEVTTLTI